MSQSAKHSLSSRTTPLQQWLHQTIARTGISVQYRLRGNALHLLCRKNPCPDQTSLLHWLLPLLQTTDFSTLLPGEPLYQIWLYGCQTDDNRPRWTTSLYLHQLKHHLEQLQVAAPIAESTTATVAAVSTAAPPLALSNVALAKQGNEMAIACHLSETLNELGVSVQVSVKVIPYTQPQNLPLSAKRLWIACQAAYSPDPSLLSEPITQILRQLEVEGFHDAVILFQVIGETKPDWALRVDLTPSSEMLREWARWGDVEAIRRWLNQEIAALKLQITTATLNTTTLHLCCSGLPDSPYVVVEQHKRAKAEIALLLEAIAPQGIHAVTLYGQLPHHETPVWIEWLDLPAAQHSELAESALNLAKQGNWDAISFLLHRLLNANLDHYLATGGIRLQLLPKQDLLHVMSEASRCPDRKQVCEIVIRFLRQLELAEVAGVRFYGRRAGQKKPLWSYGVDFATRTRLVPEVTPEFAATDTYVADLLPQPGETVLRPDLTAGELQTRWTRWRQRALDTTQQALLRTQLFSFAPAANDANALPGEVNASGRKVALIWGTTGVLLLLQTNWFLSQVSRWQAAQPKLASASEIVAPVAAAPSVVSSTSPLPIPDITFKNAQPETQQNGVFNSSGFTRSDLNNASSDKSSDKPAKLLYTPHSAAETRLTAEILAEAAPFPSFNSQQMDQKLQLYYRFVEKYGAPDILVVGSSRALRGVDPVALRDALSGLGYSNVSIFNFGINGATAQVVDLLVEHLLLPGQKPRLILWADGARAFNSGGTDVTYNGIAASEAYRQLLAGTLPVPVPAADAEATKPAQPRSINTSLTDSYKAIDRWFSDQLATLSGRQSDRDQLKHWLQQRAVRVFGAQEPLAPAVKAINAQASQADRVSQLLQSGQPLPDQTGFLSLAVQFNPATYYQKYARVLGAYDSDYANFRINGVQTDALQSLLRFSQANQIPVVFINLPLTEDYLDPVRLEHEQAFQDYMVQLALTQPGFIFRDLSQQWTTQYSYFSDPSHLNRYGAHAVSLKLAQDAKIPWTKLKQPAPEKPIKQAEAAEPLKD
jgi:hypothetical protein